MNIIHRPGALLDPADFLLAEVAYRIQLRPSQFDTAVARYRTIAEWVERDGSPLKDKVGRFYLQGSMSIGATIWSRLDAEDYDIDVIVELLFPANISPQVVLDLLFEAVRGEPGSRYYDKAERRTRCVTVHYEDMHLDLTPSVLVAERDPRTSRIYHHKPDDSEEPTARHLANPWGFGKWYQASTPFDHDFATAFARFGEGRPGYEITVREKADAEPAPEQEPITGKSKALVVHQLTKRWRNKQFNGKNVRRPPSPLLACINAESAGQTETLAEELEHQARCLLARFQLAQAQGRLIEVRNPTCEEDEFTDRWPADLRAQEAFIRDLRELVTKAARLRDPDCDLPEMQAIMADLFGEHPTTAAFDAFNESFGKAVQSGNVRTGSDGRVDLVRSGIAGIAAAAASTSSRSATAPRHTFYGGRWRPR